jgi:hypothetical protein
VADDKIVNFRDVDAVGGGIGHPVSKALSPAGKHTVTSLIPAASEQQAFRASLVSRDSGQKPMKSLWRATTVGARLDFALSSLSQDPEMKLEICGMRRLAIAKWALEDHHAVLASRRRLSFALRFSSAMCAATMPGASSRLGIARLPASTSAKKSTNG